ncbi:MAG: hypothetical protein JSS66_05515 [Armatimonadetes bacterium]|nr:hypothetical protein [Armatimonadota bacterium]
MDFALGALVALTCDMPDIGLRAGKMGVVLVCFENTVWLEVVNSSPGQRVVSVPKVILVSIGDWPLQDKHE